MSPVYPDAAAFLEGSDDFERLLFGVFVGIDAEVKVVLHRRLDHRHGVRALRIRIHALFRHDGRNFFQGRLTIQRAF